MNTQEQTPVVIIGSGLAGWTAARELRKLDTQLPIVMITESSGDFYAKPTLSNAQAQRKNAAQLVTTPAAQMAQQTNVALRAFCSVSFMDTQAHEVLIRDGAQTHRQPFSQLILATGAQPIRLPLPGSGAAQVISVNNLQDFEQLQEHLQPSARVLIMGAGLIGCEFANDLASSWYRVTVVDPAQRAIAALLPQQASQQLQARLADVGVQWQLGRSVQSLDKQTLGFPAPLSVQLSDGQMIEADVVLSAIGLRPDLRLAQAAGLAVDRGIMVNAQLQTSSPDIFALGDSAQYSSDSLGSISRPLPYVLPIMQAAKVLATNVLALRKSEPLAALKFPVMPVSIKTPALPLVVAPPAPGQPGHWQEVAHGEWQWLDEQGLLQGFALAGSAAPQRGKWVKALEAGQR
jgi:rubredoxin---NAD+ reductase